ncbi:MAG: biotin transporter BioY [Chloroflexota bacterium]|jgi:biotin transport system substrate-specific component
MTTARHAGRLAGRPGLTLGDYLIPASVASRAPAWARDLALVAAGVILLIIGARVAFELPAVSLGRLYVPDNPFVPITLQTFGVLFTSAALGARRGSSATAVYLLLGAIGLPVFAFERSGPETFVALESGRVVLGTTGGYLVGFLLASGVVGALAQRGWDRRLGGSLGAMLIGTLLIYAVGLTWLALALGSGVVEVLPFGLYPFVPGDVLKLLLAAGALPLGWRLAGRRASGGSSNPG